MDNTEKTGKADDSRINVNQEHELQYWSEKFGVSRDELRKAVEAAGPIADKVQEYLSKNK